MQQSEKVRRAGKRIVLLLVALVGLWLVSSGLVAWKLTRRHRAQFPEAAPAEFQNLRLRAADGVEVGAWFHPGAGDAVCAVVVHGNGGSRTSMVPVIELWRSLDGCVLALSVRAHGDSEGEINDFGYSAALDVEAAVGHVERVLPGRKIIVHGRSLGAAAAIFAADELGARASAYLLEQPYRDLESAIWNRLRMFLPDFVGWFAYQGLYFWSTVILSPSIAEISPEKAIGKMPPDIPVVILTGTRDRHATVEDVRAVVARRVGAELLLFDGAEHVELDRFETARYREVVRRLVEAF